MHARFYAPNLAPGHASVELPADEAAHLSRVLRLGPGAEVHVFDGRGHEFAGRVELVERSRVIVAIGDAVPDGGTEPRVAVVLGQALLKGDSMDQVVRDAVMLGVVRIVPLETGRCDRAARRAKASGRVERWRRIAVSSVKQCGRTVVPEVADPVSLEDCLRQYSGTPGFLLAEPTLAPAVAARPGPAFAPPASALLLVGPEGGWTSEEASAATAAGCVPLTLGRRTLRADAAATVGLAALQCAFGDFIVPGAGTELR